jgi:PAS domain S-box-containing protein
VKVSAAGLAILLAMATVLWIVERRRRLLVERRERWLQAIVDNIPAVVYVKDRDGRYLMVNRRLESLHARPRREIVGRTEYDFFPREVADVLRRNDQRVFATAEPFECEEVSYQPDGPHTYLALKFPLAEPGEPPHAVGGVSTDITDRKRQQERLAELNAELGRSLEETRAINHELESFSYSVSHDLRAPLRAIDGFARILEEDHAAALGAEGRRVLAVVRTNARNMARLIDDLLSFSRTSRRAMDFATIDMTALACEAVEGLQLGAGLAEPEVVVSPLPRARGDAALLRQVFANLIGNAVKFSRGRAAARVEVEGERRAGEALYRVRDNGVGFDARYAEQLFGVFQRLHRSEEFEGTGVGLAIVQRVVHRHGGRVWAEGKPGEGATFSFTLPVDIEEGGGA